MIVVPAVVSTLALPPMPLTLVFRRDDPSALVRNFIAVGREVGKQHTQHLEARAG